MWMNTVGLYHCRFGAMNYSCHHYLFQYTNPSKVCDYAARLIPLVSCQMSQRWFHHYSLQQPAQNIRASLEQGTSLIHLLLQSMFRSRQKEWRMSPCLQAVHLLATTRWAQWASQMA